MLSWDGSFVTLMKTSSDSLGVQWKGKQAEMGGRDGIPGEIREGKLSKGCGSQEHRGTVEGKVSEEL